MFSSTVDRNKNLIIKIKVKKKICRQCQSNIDLVIHLRFNAVSVFIKTKYETNF